MVKQRPGTVSTILWHFTGGPPWNLKKQRQGKKTKSDNDALKALKGILTCKHLKLGQYQEVVSVTLSAYQRYDAQSKKFISERNKRITVKTSPVCCLADIPLMHLAYHANRYGKIAIGFHREAAIRSGFNPVFYTLENHSVIQNLYLASAKIRSIYTDGIIDQIENISYELESELEDLIPEKVDMIPLNFTSVTKDLDVLKTDIDTIEESVGKALSFIKTFKNNEFSSIYCEREWRSVKQFNFSFDDIAFIVLPKNNEIHKNFIENDIKELKIPSNIPILPWEDLLEH